jgi:hypothetical protein
VHSQDIAVLYEQLVNKLCRGEAKENETGKNGPVTWA